jgi:hypothetical protein
LPNVDQDEVLRSGPCCWRRLVNGAAVSFAWSSTQTLIAQLAEGKKGLHPADCLRQIRLRESVKGDRRCNANIAMIANEHFPSCLAIPTFQPREASGFPAQEGTAPCREPGGIDCYYVDRLVCRPGQARNERGIAPAKEPGVAPALALIWMLSIAALSCWAM